MGKRSVVLLSGGIDSATTLAVSAAEGFASHALTFRYGQRHEAEIGAARRVAERLEAREHVILDIDLRQFGGSALTSRVPVPKNRSLDDLTAVIPSTYVPARNTIFLALALAWAEVLGAQDIFIGVNALDYSGYPDCRPEYVQAFERMAQLATRSGVEGHPIRVRTPLLELTKGDIIKLGARLGVDFSLTHSCYDPAPSGAACGGCDACVLRRKGFHEASLPDPIPYADAASRST